MKRKTCVLIFFMIALLLPVFAANLYLPSWTDTTTEGNYWKTKSLVDKYGDVSGRALYTQFSGTFSNSATKDSNFTSELIITKSDVYFIIYEYGKYLATGYGISDTYYLSFGNERIEIYLDSDGKFVIGKKYAQTIVEYIARLSSSGIIGVRISGGKYSTSTYVGTIEAKGFGRIARSILETQDTYEKNRQTRIENNAAAAFTFSMGVMGDKMALTLYYTRYKSIGFNAGILGYDPFKSDRKINISEDDGLHLGINYPIGDRFLIFAGGELGAGWGIAAGGVFFMSPVCFSAEVSYNFLRENLHFSIGVGIGGWNAVD